MVPLPIVDGPGGGHGPPRPWRGEAAGMLGLGPPQSPSGGGAARSSPCPQVDGVAEGIGEDLHLHVAGAGQVALQQHPVIVAKAARASA